MENKEIFEGIYGYNETKESLRRIIDMLNNPKKYKDLGSDLLKGLLLWGAPGTGKTTLALSVLNAVDRKNYIFRKEGNNDKFVDKLTKVFDEASKNAPSIMLLDDIDKFDNLEVGCDNLYTLQSLIDSVKDKDVFIIATTNNYRDLPSSLKRRGRFDVDIKVEKPIESDSYMIIDSYLKNKRVSKGIDLNRVNNLLACHSCAEIESVCKKAAIYAGYKNQKEIKMEDIVNASLELMYGGEENEIESGNDKDIELTAYHEAGHLLVAELLNPGSVRFASVTKNYLKQGVVAYHTDIEGEDDINLINSLTRVLAGKAAVEVVFNRCDIGTESDLQKAFHVARDIVDRYCMFSFDSWIYNRDETSEVTKENKDKRSSDLVNEHYTKAKCIIESNRVILDKIASILIKNKIIYEDEIKTIMDEYRSSK